MLLESMLLKNKKKILVKKNIPRREKHHKIPSAVKEES